jgi:acyl carrier protein
MAVGSEKPDTLHPSREGVLRGVKQIVGQHMGIAPETIREGDALLADLGCDSLDVIEITMEVEEHFDITVPDEASQRINTVGQITDGVLELLGQSKTASSSV